MIGKRKTGPQQAILAGVVLLLSLLTGCAGPAGASDIADISTPRPSSTLALREQLELLPGAEEVTGGDAGLTVVMAADATRDEVLAAAREANTVATALGSLEDLSMVRVGGGFDSTLDLPTPSPWSITVYPGDSEAILDALAGILDVEQVPGTTGISVISGWPYVTIPNVDQFASVFDAVSATPLFADGGTYSTDGDHLQIVHVAKRTSPEAVRAITALAVDYPNAEVLLQATTAGPQWPQLYVARLSVEEAAAIDARLQSPELVDTDPEGFPQRYQLTVTGPDGPVYIMGTFGNVPG